MTIKALSFKIFEMLLKQFFVLKTIELGFPFKKTKKE